MIRGLSEREAQRGTTTGGASADITADEPFRGRVHLHLRSSVPEAARSRQRAVLDRLEELDGAGAVEGLAVSEWPDRVRLAATPSSESAARTYEELVETVGTGALEPFFQERPAVGPVERAVVLPVVCVTARRAGELVGVFPRWRNGDHHSVADCLRSLAAGDCIENVAARG